MIDLNDHNQEWLDSTTMNRLGVETFDFATVSGCDQLVVGATHASSGTLDLLMTDFSDLSWVAVVLPIGSLDHSSFSAAISMVQAVPNRMSIYDLPWRNIWSADNPSEVRNEHLSLLVKRYLSTMVILLYKDKPWFDDQCMRAFDIPKEVHLRWSRDNFRVNWEEFVRYEVRVNETKRQCYVRNRDILMNDQSPHNWFSTLKFAMIRSTCWWWCTGVRLGW